MEPLSGTDDPSAGRTAYVTHPDCSRHDTGWKHPEHQGRLPAVARAVHRDMLTLFPRLLEVEGVPAAPEDLRLAHAERYVERVRERCAEAADFGGVLPLDGEVVVSGASWDAVLAAVGCVTTAVARVEAREARNAFCAVRPPGHGAHVAAPGAFGIFNGVALAALRLARGTPERRVLVVEWGARGGAGTASIVAGNERIRFLSVHAEGGPPYAASGRVVREVSAGCGGAAMLSALISGLDELEGYFQPDFVLLSLGCDALAGDPLGSLALDPRDYYALTAELRARAERTCEGRLVSVLEEGYQAEQTASAVVQHLRALARLPPLES